MGTNFRLQHGPDRVCPLYPLPRGKGLARFTAKASPQPGNKSPNRTKRTWVVVSAKPGSAMPCCPLRKSKRGGGVRFERIKRLKRKRQQNTVPWSFPPSCWVIPAAGGEDAHGAGTGPLSTPTGTDGARVPAGVGRAIHPQPTSHPRSTVGAPGAPHTSMPPPPEAPSGGTGTTPTDKHSAGAVSDHPPAH